MIIENFVFSKYLILTQIFIRLNYSFRFDYDFFLGYFEQFGTYLLFSKTLKKGLLPVFLIDRRNAEFFFKFIQ